MIHGITDSQRLYFGGKIRTGITTKNANGKEYPKNTEHFVMTDAPRAREVYGDTPKELHIMFPSDELSRICEQWLMWYTASELRCKGDGRIAEYRGVEDVSDLTGNPGVSDGSRERICRYDKCPNYPGGKQCKETMRLIFLLPRVSMLELYALTTGASSTMAPFMQTLRLALGTFKTLQNTVFKLAKVQKEFLIKDQKTGKPMRTKNWTLELSIALDFMEKYGNDCSERLRLMGGGLSFLDQYKALPVPELHNDIPDHLLLPDQSDGPPIEYQEPEFKEWLKDKTVAELFEAVSVKLGRANTPAAQEVTAATKASKEELVSYLKSRLE